jgi:Holliday junction resolvasome RuvABC DNA-binding subunit
VAAQAAIVSPTPLQQQQQQQQHTQQQHHKGCDEAKVQTLVALGFSETDSVNALLDASNDVKKAASLLLSTC